MRKFSCSQQFTELWRKSFQFDSVLRSDQAVLTEETRKRLDSLKEGVAGDKQAKVLKSGIVQVIRSKPAD